MDLDVAAGLAYGLIGIAFALAGWTYFRAQQFSTAFPAEGRFVDTRTGRLHVVERGKSDPEKPVPVLFIHGASGSFRVWPAAFGERLDRLGHVLMVDRPGHGASERKTGRQAAALEVQAGAIIDMLDGLNLDRVIVVAHSWAGALALRLALNHPGRVAGLMLIAPASHPWPTGVDLYYTIADMPLVGSLFSATLTLPVGEFLLARGIAHVFEPMPAPGGYARAAGIPLVLRPAQFVANAEDVAGLCAEIEKQQPRYGEIQSPVVVLSGDADTVVWTSLHTAGLARDIAQARITILPGIGHAPHHARPDLVEAAIMDLQPRYFDTSSNPANAQPSLQE